MGKETGMYQCPSCSQAVVFRSKETRIKICACGQVLHRLDSDDLAAKPAFTIPDHNDWVQVGTTGTYEGRPFEVIGRFRVWLSESVYNYWTILFDDGSPAWLSEGYGMYSIMQRMTPEKATTIADLNMLRTTDYLMLKGEYSWFLQRKDEAWKYEVEGEVWMPQSNDQFPIYDLYAVKNQHIEAIEFLRDYVVFYDVEYVPYKSLQLKNVNETPPTPKDVVCTECNTTIAVKTFPYAQSCSCSACGMRFVYKGGGKGFVSQKKEKENDNALAIPLGSKGTLKGIDYEVIGYTLKEENDATGERWREYVLYNRAEGYAFLSEYKGNWMYAREQGNSPVTAHENPETIYYNGEEYDLYNRYKIRVVDTAGEFPFNIFDDGNIVSAEFISPPRMWAYEKSREEGINWFLVEYQNRKQLLEQFPFALPVPTEPGILNPTGHINLAKLIKITLAGMAIMVLIHFLIGMTEKETEVFSGDLQLRDSTASSIFVSPKFALHKWRSNLAFDLHTAVDNNWLDMEATLVDAVSGQEYGLQQTVEYYHGVDDGESWSEGSTHETAYLSSLPAGNYYLRLEASRDTTNGAWGAVRDVEVVVKNDVPMHRNLFIFLGLMLVWPLCMIIWYFYNERSRWAGSRFSPFNKK